MMRVVLLLLLYFVPALAFAGAFSVDPADKSVEYLGIIFGEITPLGIRSTGDALFSSIIGLFNQSIFVLAIIIVVYTTVIGTLNTAQEGQFLGKQWHPILVPFRAGIGIYLLLPTKYGSAVGYNWIQLAVLWFLMQGIGAANAIWSQALNGLQAQQTQGTTTPSTPQVRLTNVSSTVNSIYSNLNCNALFNLNPDRLNQDHGELYIAYPYNDSIQFGLLSQPLTVKGHGCGTVSIPSISSGINQGSNAESEARISTMKTAVMVAVGCLQNIAEAAALGTPPAADDPAFKCAKDALTNGARDLGATFPTRTELTQQQTGDGWIFAGSYYFQLVENGFGGGISSNLGNSQPDSSQMQQEYGQGTINQIDGQRSSAPQGNQGNNSESSTNSSTSLQFNAPSMGSELSQIYDAVFGTFFDDLVSELDTFMTEGSGDPLVSMAAFGSLLTNLTELTFWTALLLVFTAWSISAIMYCMQPLGPTLDFVMSIFMPIAALVISLLWAEGITLALYVPLIPYLVFSFAAVGWIILVIEALLGAPLIALSLVIPSEDEIGKAGHAFIILLGLFLRPSLMILGFIFGIQLLTIGIGMLNFGFWATLTASTGASAGVGIFGLVAVIFMYVAIAVGMVHEAFTLIYQLPNKILRWLGGGPEGDEAGSHAKELKGSVQKGTGIGKSMMSSTLGKFSGGKGK